MEDRPNRLIGTDLQRALQAQRRDPVFAGGKMPAGSKPDRERSSGSVEDGACRHRGAAAASCAHDPAVAGPPPRRVAAGWADEARGPPQPLEVVQAVCVRLKPGMELSQGPGVLGACTGIGTGHDRSLRSTPVKWRAQSVHIKIIAGELAVGCSRTPKSTQRQHTGKSRFGRVAAQKTGRRLKPVSYTHLTLPTIYSV